MHWLDAVRFTSAFVVLAALGGISACLDRDPLPRPEFATVATAAASHTRHYVKPGGLTSGDGTDEASAWDLQHAFNGAVDGTPRLVPGDTVWLLAGDYPGPFTVRVRGEPGAPIVFKQAPGQVARLTLSVGWIVEEALSVPDGADYTEYWDFEIANLHSGERSTPGEAEMPHGIWNRADYAKFVNLVIHDFGVGLFNDKHAQAPPVGVVISGCIVYNNGWDTPDRGHGHGLYVKNNSRATPLVVADNIVFNNFGYGIHLYTGTTGSAAGDSLINIHVIGNVSFNNGTISINGDSGLHRTSANLGHLGDVPGIELLFERNMLFFSRNAELNAGPNAAFPISAYRNLIYRRSNRPPGENNVRRLNYVVGGSTRTIGGTLADGWIVAPGEEDFTAAVPASGITYFVRPTAADPTRANVVVYSSGATTATVDLQGFLDPGDTYELRNVQDFRTVTSDTYSGPIDLELTGVVPPSPAGVTKRQPVATGPYFNAFVVRKTGSQP